MTLQRRRDSEDGPADLSTKAPHFFKIIMPQTLQEGKLWIPKKFISKYGVDLSNMAFLTVPNGTNWKVKMEKRDGEVCFQNGWCEFARCHALTLGHLLVFRYKGNSHFYVLIFDATATEIDYHLDDQHQVRRMEDIESDDNSLEIMNGFMPSRKTREKSPLPYPLPHKRAKTNPRSSDLQAGDTHFRPELAKSKGSMLEKSKMNAAVSFTRRESKEECSGATKRCPKSEVIERIQPLSASEKDRALQRVRAFESKNHFFMVVMQPSYVYPGTSMSISPSFAKKYMRKMSGEFVILRSFNGGTWSVKFSFYEAIAQTKAMFRQGWKEFARDNNLKVGDVCIFELTNGIEVAFKVAIFQAANDVDCPLLNGSAHGGGGNRVGRKSSPLVKPESDCNLDDVSFSHDQCPGKDGCVSMSTNQRRQKAKALVKNQDYKALEKKQELMTSNGKAENLVRANAFKSENPLYVVIMQPSYINGNGRVSLPHSIINYLPRKGFTKDYTKGSTLTVKLQVVDRLWPVKLYAYERMYQGSFCKLSSGWTAFARENTLQVRDVCVFELIMRDDVVLKVHIFKCFD